MSIILIDYENINESSFAGCDYLDSSDEIIFFYSKSCEKIAQRILYPIIDSGCKIEKIKLRTVRTNALDFYIASVIGKIFGSGYEGEIIIVSHDKGFESVAEYWKYYENRTVILAKDIANGIVHTSDIAGRCRRSRIQTFLRQETLEADFSLLHFSRKFREFLDDESINLTGAEFDTICKIGASNNTLRFKYFECIKNFGKQRGLDLYSGIKQCMRPTDTKSENPVKDTQPI